MSEMDNELRERMVRLEAKLEILPEMKTTLEQLVEANIRNRDNRKRIEQNTSRLDALEDEMSTLRNYIESRWWVLATLLLSGITILEILFRIVLG